MLRIPGDSWTVSAHPTTATLASVARAAGNGSNVCDSVVASIACGGTAQTPISVYVRDGATGAGAILWAAVLAAPVGGCASVCATNLGIVGTPGNAMTIEFSAAGVAASLQAVSASGSFA